MRSFYLIHIFLLFSLSVSSQTLKGIVTDAETGKALYPVTVTNHVTEHTGYTDEQGYFSIAGKSGDVVSFSFLGYRTLQIPAPADLELRVALYPLSVKMKEYIYRDYTPFQKDSIEMTQRYSHELNTQPASVGYSSANGGGFTGLIGTPIKKLSKSYKQNQRFKANFKSGIEQKYIDTRYTPSVVTALTGFAGDTLAYFMNSYPMDYGFARAATDLELKMWIRNNYKDYLHKEVLLKSGRK